MFQTPHQELDLFHYMINRIGDEIMVVDKTGQIVFVNNAVLHGSGYSRGSLLSKNIADLRRVKITPKQWQKNYFDVVKKCNGPFNYTTLRKSKGNETQVLEVKSVYMNIEKKEYVLAVSRNITESVQLSKKIRESEELYRLLSEQASDGILLINLSGKIMYANNASCSLFGRVQKNILGAHFKSFLESGSVPNANKCFSQVKKGKNTVCSVLNIKTGKGKIVAAEFSGTPIFDGDKIIYVHTIVRDINERVRLDNMIRESEKMKALQNFITGTAQEIHQPLKGLFLRSDGLVKKYKDQHFEYIGFREYKDIVKTIESMRDQAKYCFQTVDRLIDIHKKKIKFKNNCCNVELIIKEVLQAVSHDLNIKDINVKLKVPKECPQLAIGVVEFNQVMNNIVTNAVQSMLSAGTIEIRVENLMAENMVKISCIDEGIGISKEYLSQIFDPFFTTKKRGLEKSSGLGLSIVYSIVKSYKGQVSIKSSLRKGTEVIVLLPVYKTLKNKK